MLLDSQPTAVSPGCLEQLDHLAREQPEHL